MARLVVAQVLIRLVPFRLWRRLLDDPLRRPRSEPGNAVQRQAWVLARHVDRAAVRLPGHWACLARAIALAAMLRSRSLPYCLRIAARPAPMRGGADDLHAWVDVGTVRVIGDLPGQWAVVYEAGGK